MSESSVLKQTFDVQKECTSTTAVHKTDYLETEEECGDPALSNNTDCMVHGLTSGRSFENGCGASDDVCKNIVYQSKCGNLQRWASQQTTFETSGGTKEFALVAQHEIYWKTNCPITMRDIIKASKNLSSTKQILFLNMVIGIITEAFALLILFIDILSACLAEAKLSTTARRKVIGIRFIFVVITLIVASVAVHFVENTISISNASTNYDCLAHSDTRTKEIFRKMSDKITSAHNLVISSTAVASASIIVWVCLFIDKEGENKSSGVEMRENVILGQPGTNL